MALNRPLDSGTSSYQLSFRHMVSSSPRMIPASSSNAHLLPFLLCLSKWMMSCLLGPLSLIFSRSKAFLYSAFTIKDLGLAKYLLGIELVQSSLGSIFTSINTLQTYLLLLVLWVHARPIHPSLRATSSLLFLARWSKTLPNFADFLVAFCISVSLARTLLMEFNN